MPALTPKRLSRLQTLLGEAEVLWRHGSLEQAEARCRAALRTERDYLPGAYLLGILLMAQHRPGESLQFLYRVVDAEPADADAQFNLGLALRAVGRWAEALKHLLVASSVRADDSAALINIGVCYQALDRHAEAIESFRRVERPALAVAEARNNLGRSLRALGRYAEAIRAHDEAIAAVPGFALAHAFKAYALSALGKSGEALATYRLAADLPPEQGISRQEGLSAVSDYLMALNYSDAVDGAQIAAEHRRCAARFEAAAETAAARRPAGGRLRIGYLSPDFRDHPVAQFVEPLLANHDAAAFEVFCYHANTQEDAASARLRSLVPHWLQCAMFSDAALVERIRADKIDVLVELAGHTSGNRLSALAARAAPVQVTYLGYPSTTGVPAIDYRISDPRVDPSPESEALSVERILRPWPTYFCFRPPAVSPEPGPLPATRNGYFTFACFNNLLKLSDAFLTGVSRVLQRVPHSRLVVKAHTLAYPEPRDALSDRLQRAGVDLTRVELRGWRDHAADHLADYRSIDIAIDSFPYNGATTTCEALWMGVPVVSLQCDRHAGRMGSSILHAVGLGDLVVGDVEGYARKCAELADLEGLAALRATLRERMRSSPLMDEAGFTRAIERCYRDIRLEPGSR